MNTILTIVCICSSVTFALLGLMMLISTIDSMIEDRKRAKRDAEYHEARMKELNNK